MKKQTVTKNNNKKAKPSQAKTKGEQSWELPFCGMDFVYGSWQDEVLLRKG